MNNRRRKRLQQAMVALETVNAAVSAAADEEQDCLDNLPENLQGSEQYEKMENAVSLLQEAVENLDTAFDHIQEALY